MTAVVPSSPEGLKKPTYAVGAVDHALLTLDMLGRRPFVRLTELATELGIGRATAHRLLQMMIYRGFAIQNRDRSYAAGPALYLRRRSNDAHEFHQLQARFHPLLEELSQFLGETVHLKVLVGIEAVCLDSVVGSKPLATTGAQGMHFPAEQVSGGMALMARLPTAELRRRYAGRPSAGMAGLERELATTRRRGFGLVIDEGKAGITSVAAVALDAEDHPLAALTCSAPTMRLSRAQTVQTAVLLQETADLARTHTPPVTAVN